MKEKLIQLFEEVQIPIAKFNKQNYEISFQNQYETYRELFEEIEKAVENAEQEEETVLEIASVIPEYVEEKLSALKSKRKAENIVIDYNYTMVTYVFPLLNYNKTVACKMITDKMLELWNQKISKNPIQNSTYESIHEGFSQRLCYITTAVCESLQKPDDCYELQILRNYRDEYLMSQKDGKDIVMKYYDIAPTIVKRINQTEHAEEIYKNIYTKYLMPCIRMVEREELEECKDTYCSMVHELQKKYLYS